MSVNLYLFIFLNYSPLPYICINKGKIYSEYPATIWQKSIIELVTFFAFLLFRLRNTYFRHVIFFF